EDPAAGVLAAGGARGRDGRVVRVVGDGHADLRRGRGRGEDGQGREARGRGGRPGGGLEAADRGGDRVAGGGWRRARGAPLRARMGFAARADGAVGEGPSPGG